MFIWNEQSHHLQRINTFKNNISAAELLLTYRQCFSTRRLRAIFSPTSVHTGFVRTIFAKSALTALTRPPVDSEPMLTISTSFLDNFWTCRDTNMLDL